MCHSYKALKTSTIFYNINYNRPITNGLMYDYERSDV